MKISGLHLLLTYRCTLECEHCFVYGSPWQNGVMTIEQVRHILQAGLALGTVRSIYFEGGEPFLYYATLLQGVLEAHQAGFEVGIVSNAYWATSPADARLWLEPFAGKISDLSVSSDLFHWSEASTYLAQNAQAAAASLGIPVGTIEIAQPQSRSDAASGQLPLGESGVMFRGRAAEKLAGQVVHSPLEGFTTCPYEDLRDPGRLHVDPFGNLFVCQGISIGNLYHTPLNRLIADYQPDRHPITGPLLAGGPAELSRVYPLPHAAVYADACHACDDLRRKLRGRFPEILTPDEVYGGLAPA
jgi:hypothetical protein